MCIACVSLCDKLSGYTPRCWTKNTYLKTIFGKHVDIHADGFLPAAIHVQMGLFNNSEIKKLYTHTNWQNGQNSLVIVSNIIVCNGNFHTNWPFFWKHTHTHLLYSLFALFWSKPHIILFLKKKRISVFAYRFTRSMWGVGKTKQRVKTYLGYDRICKSYAYFSTIRQMTRYFCIVTYGPFCFWSPNAWAND